MNRQKTALDMRIMALVTMVILIAIYAGSRQVRMQNLSFFESSSKVINLSSDVGEAAPVPAGSGSEEKTLYRAVMANPGTGAARVEWSAPYGTHVDDQGMAQYRTVVVDPGSGGAVKEWLASPEDEAIDRQALALYRKKVSNGQAGEKEIIVWR